MNTIKAIALGVFSLMSLHGAQAQVTKAKKQPPKFYSDPKMKVEDVSNISVIEGKGYGGYYNNRPYYFDAERHRYYQVYNGRRVYYQKGWIPD